MESGVIRQVGTPTEMFHRPANMFVAGFIGSTPMNLLPGVVTSDGVDVGSATLPIDGSSAEAGREVIYGIRPEHVAIGGAGPVTGAVSITENLGTDFLVTVDVGGVMIKATIPEGDEPNPGDTVSLAPSSRRVLLYDKESGALL